LDKLQTRDPLRGRKEEKKDADYDAFERVRFRAFPVQEDDHL